VVCCEMFERAKFLGQVHVMSDEVHKHLEMTAIPSCRHLAREPLFKSSGPVQTFTVFFKELPLFTAFNFAGISRYPWMRHIRLDVVLFSNRQASSWGRLVYVAKLCIAQHVCRVRK
jgi:hypothetical protein